MNKVHTEVEFYAQYMHLMNIYKEIGHLSDYMTDAVASAASAAPDAVPANTKSLAYHMILRIIALIDQYEEIATTVKVAYANRHLPNTGDNMVARINSLTDNMYALLGRVHVAGKIMRGRGGDAD
jgi:hypothetical protein